MAVEWIRQYEPGSRGLYGAPIGWISGNDDSGEFAVALRSGVFAGQQGVLYAGCGIVADSQAELEREETKNKNFNRCYEELEGRFNESSRNNDRLFNGLY